jgi:hypothetical protein
LRFCAPALATASKVSFQVVPVNIPRTCKCTKTRALHQPPTLDTSLARILRAQICRTVSSRPLSSQVFWFPCKGTGTSSLQGASSKDVLDLFPVASMRRRSGSGLSRLPWISN